MFTRMRKPITTLVLTAGAALFLTAAQAQTVRFISADGDNASTCATRAAPCRTLQRGINKTPAGGEVQILDSGAYGNATIVKSITISAVGVAATVGNIEIDAPAATVVLRGLLLSGTGLPPATSGIAILNALAVHIVGCQVERFPGSGIDLDADNAEVFVLDSIVRSNGSNGLLIHTNSTGVRLTIDNSRFENNGTNGIIAAGPSSSESTISRVVASGNGNIGIGSSGGRVNVTSTTVTNNGGNGFYVFSSPAAQMTIESSVASGNAGNGLRVENGVGTVSNSVFTNNNLFGFQRIAGTLQSRGNNTVSGNTIAQVNGTIVALGAF